MNKSLTVGVAPAVGNAIERLQLEWRLGLFVLAASVVMLKQRFAEQTHSVLVSIGMARPQPQRTAAVGGTGDSNMALASAVT